MSYRLTGSKYEATKDETTTQIAARIRADVKAARAAGELPDALKVSVTTRYYSGGSSIDLNITGGLDGIQVYSPERMKVDRDDPRTFHGDNEYPPYTPEYDEILKRLQAIHRAYNFDDSDAQVDYFHVNYHGHAGLDWQYRETIRARELAALEAPAPAPEPAPEPAADYQLTEDELAYDPASFGFIMHGGAMINAGIIDGDLLIVSPNTKVGDGDIVVIDKAGELICAVRHDIDNAGPQAMRWYCDAEMNILARHVLGFDESVKERGKVVLVRRKLLI